MTGPETAGVARDVVAGGQGLPADRGPSGNLGNGPATVSGDGNGTDAGNVSGNVSLGNGDLNLTNATGGSTGVGTQTHSDGVWAPGQTARDPVTPRVAGAVVPTTSALTATPTA